MRGFIIAFLQKNVMLIIIILLIVTLVVVAVMRDRFTQLMGVINPWAENKALEAQCRDKCRSWCEMNPDEPGTSWDNIRLFLPRGEINCTEIRAVVFGDDIGICTCDLG